jgi:hypothetical protein
MERKSPS